MVGRRPIIAALSSVMAGLIPAAGTLEAAQLGDPAPPLKIDEWVKGSRVDLKAGKGKKVFVIEFWATWCGPCRISIPHLTELQKKYRDKDVVIVGVSDEPADVIRDFVEQAGDKMDYTVAADDSGATTSAYMRAFGVNGIPHAFIVDKAGRIVWHGHPETGMTKALEAVLAGTYDLEAARNIEKARPLMEEYFMGLFRLQAEKDPQARKAQEKKLRDVGEQVIRLGGKDGGLMNDFAWTLLTGQGIRHRDLDLALRAAKAANEAAEGKDPSILDTYARALWDTGAKDEALKHQRKAVELADDARMKAALKKTLDQYEKALPPTTQPAVKAGAQGA